jgi:hypothetical protein
MNRAFAALDRAKGVDGLVLAARRLLTDDNWLRSLLDEAAGALRRDPFFVPPLRPTRNDLRVGLIVLARPRISITIDVVHAAGLAARKNRPRAGSVGFSGDVSLIRFVKAGGAVVSLWEAPPIGLEFRAADAGRCRQTGRRAVADGEILVIDGRRESFIIEGARSNLLLANATIRTEAPVSVEYDAASGAYLGCSAADERDSRLQMVSTLARLVDAEAAFPAVAGLLDHPSFFVRWHAMRELIGIDAEAALPYLKLMSAHDPHIEVREAASATLDLVSAPAAARKAA